MSFLRALRDLVTDRLLRHILLVALVNFSISILIAAVPFWIHPEIEGMGMVRGLVAVASSVLSSFFLLPTYNLALRAITHVDATPPLFVRIAWSLCAGLLCSSPLLTAIFGAP